MSECSARAYRNDQTKQLKNNHRYSNAKQNGQVGVYVGDYGLIAAVLVVDRHRRIAIGDARVKHGHAHVVLRAIGAAAMKHSLYGIHYFYRGRVVFLVYFLHCLI